MTAQNQHGRIGRLAAAALLACLATALVAASAPAPATSARPAALQKDLDALVAAGAPGAVLFLRDGQRTVVLTGGLGNLARKTPIRPGDHFKVASLTKTYTATVVLQLVGEKKLALNDTVEQRLPGVVPGGSGITLRQLLNHTSGLYDFEVDAGYLKPYLAGDFGHYWSPRQLVRMAVSHKPLFAPGSRYSYSNTNYVVAQLIVEAVTGKPLGVELKRRIFAPLHLRATSYPAKPGLPSPFAHGYMLLGKPPLADVTGLSHSMAPGSGGIVSTVADVADFYRALLSGRLLPAAQLESMKTTVPERDAKGVLTGGDYGLGIGSIGGSCPGWGHSGELPGYDVSTAFSENGQHQAVLMINQDGTTLPKRALSLYYALLGKAFCPGA